MGETVLEALRAMRPPFALYETDLHALISQRFTQCGLTFTHEAAIAKGCRIDYLVDGIGVEIKKGKPQSKVLLRQLKRYAQCDCIQALVVVAWQSVALPGAINGKPVYTLALTKLWGVSLP